MTISIGFTDGFSSLNSEQHMHTAAAAEARVRSVVRSCRRHDQVQLRDVLFAGIA